MNEDCARTLGRTGCHVTNPSVEAELVTQRGLLDPVHGDPFAVDLDHGDPLTMAALELRDACDVDLVDLEAELDGEGL